MEWQKEGYASGSPKIERIVSWQVVSVIKGLEMYIQIMESVHRLLSRLKMPTTMCAMVVSVESERNV